MSLAFHALTLTSLLHPGALVTPSGDTTPLKPALARFEVDAARSEVGFDGTSTLHDFTGRTRAVVGRVITDPSAPTGFLAGTIECDAAQLDTDNDGRDEKMREHLDVAHYPKITFSLAKAEGARASEHLVDLRGIFAIHGVQREYRLSSEVTDSGADGLHARGRVALQLTDHGIVPPAIALIEVGDKVEAWFDLWLRPVVETTHAATGYVLAVDEEITPIGAAAQRESHAERLFLSPAGCLWERAHMGLWLAAPKEAEGRTLALAPTVGTAQRQTAEESFAEARATMERLEEKLSKLEGVKRERAEKAVAETLGRLREALREAPAGRLVRQQVDGSDRWVMGDVIWLELRGKRAEGRFGALLSTLDGVPQEVHAALKDLDYVPAECVVRTATMGGVRRIQIVCGEPVEAVVPASAFLNSEAGK